MSAATAPSPAACNRSLAALAGVPLPP
eukprot:gene12371-biopygen1505